MPSATQDVYHSQADKLDRSLTGGFRVRVVASLSQVERQTTAMDEDRLHRSSLISRLLRHGEAEICAWSIVALGGRPTQQGALPQHKRPLPSEAMSGAGGTAPRFDSPVD